MKTEVLKNYKELINYASNNQSKEDDHYYKLNQDFTELLERFCNDEIMIFNCYRVLKEIERDLRHRKGTVSSANNLLIATLLEDLNDRLNTEVEIIRCKIANPYLLEKEMKSLSIPELLEWTDHKTDLVQLICSISNSIDNGKATRIKIVRCFEFFFQTDLGNVSDILEDINTRKKDSPTKYLESLITNFQKLLEEINNRRDKKDRF